MKIAATRIRERCRDRAFRSSKSDDGRIPTFLPVEASSQAYDGGSGRKPTCGLMRSLEKGSQKSTHKQKMLANS